MKRRIFHRVLAAAACSVALPSLRAQTGQVIKLQTGFTPGGSADVVARALAVRLAPLLGQHVIVENRPGAGGRVALTELKRAPADGSVLLLSHAGPFTTLPWLYSNAKLGFDPLKDFAHVARVAKIDFGVMINLRNPAIHDFHSLVRHLKERPDEANFATPGPGTLPHFVGLMLADALKFPLRHVPYRGTGPALNDFLAGQFPMMVDTLWVERHKVKNLKIVATTGERRYRNLPEVPTLKELGFDLVADSNFSICAPAGISPETVRRISDAVREALKVREVQDTLYSIGMEPAYLDPRETTADHMAQYKHWERPIKASGVVLE